MEGADGGMVDVAQEEVVHGAIPVARKLVPRGAVPPVGVEATVGEHGQLSEDIELQIEIRKSV